MSSNLARSSLRHAAHLNVQTLRARERGRLMLAAAAIIAVTSVTAWLLLTSSSLALGIAAIVLVPALLIWLWQHPVRGVYVLLAASALLDEIASAEIYPDDIGRFVPYFLDIATWTHIKGIAFSLNEVFMLLILLIWLLKGVATRSLRFDKGTLMWPLGLYMLMVLVGEVHGLTSGGDTTLSLWEVRAQVYLLITYVLACNLVKTRKQVEMLVWILVVGTGLRGIQGTWRYLITLHGHLAGIESIFPHEQAFFFNAFFTFAVVVFLYGGSRSLKRATLCLLPFVIMATVANQRRAAILALLVGMLVVFLVTLVAYPPRRRAVVKILLVLAVVLPPYVLVYGNKTGTIAGPARSVMSAFHPDARDASSNLYRVNEDKDILATMNTSPIIGYGFGRKMQTPYPLADISSLYIFWNLLPHDSILWVWMRLGTIGYILLWLMIGTAIVQAAGLVRRLNDPYLKGLAALIVALIIQEIVFGYLDLQWTKDRNLIALGVLFALIARLTTFARADESGAAGINRTRGPLSKNMSRRISHSLAVVDGRLK